MNLLWLLFGRDRQSIVLHRVKLCSIKTLIYNTRNQNKNISIVPIYVPKLLFSIHYSMFCVKKYDIGTKIIGKKKLSDISQVKCNIIIFLSIRNCLTERDVFFFFLTVARKCACVLLDSMKNILIAKKIQNFLSYNKIVLLIFSVRLHTYTTDK